MEKAVARLIQALKSGEKMLLYGDYDLDGTPGLALLKEGLESLGFKDVLTYQPSRLREGYGVHPHLIAGFKNMGVSLIVTVDVGITDIPAADAAAALGIDLIVTDHHLPKETLPKAWAILNPNKG